MARRIDGKFLLDLAAFVIAWTGYVLLVYRRVQSLGEARSPTPPSMSPCDCPDRPR
jgi:hypothetical protein